MTKQEIITHIETQATRFFSHPNFDPKEREEIFNYQHLGLGNDYLNSLLEYCEIENVEFIQSILTYFPEAE